MKPINKKTDFTKKPSPLRRGLGEVTKFFLTFLLLFQTFSLRADDGYRLWLKYDVLKNETLKKQYISQLTAVQAATENPTLKVAVEELQLATQGLLGKKMTLVKQLPANQKGVILKVTAIEDSNEEAYTIRANNGQIIIQANTEKGVLYGVFHLIRLAQTEQSLQGLAITSSPKIQLRLLNHWDNNNGTIERGYAGMSLWKWYELPERIDSRYIDYARANASIGINGTVLNNVNASARFLTTEYLGKVKALADAFRPYGIKVYLSVNFSAPRLIGGLPTADPLDADVRKWWKEKTDEVYSLIPDFGGFLVKANSEGEPGPMDYGRTHVDGANMLAEAVAPHNGIIMWRAFVYNSDPKKDRFAQAYNEFKPFDGKFLPNVIIQVKNGPIDFQQREPFSPLFGTMKKTPVSIEFQLTQEYLGWATHWVFEAPLFEEVLKTDTYAKGKGSMVAKIIDGSTLNYPLTSLVGVANTGSDRNWTGHPMAQANWFALGRLAWNPEISSETIADEWTRMTFSNEKSVVSTIKKLMMESREIYVNYTTPFGLHHVMGEGHHFGPEPWVNKAPRPDWTAVYYHKADSVGLGFDRTASGSNAISQYAPELQEVYGDAKKTPLPYLLWFHHVKWTEPMPSGKIFWDDFVSHYYDGVKSVEQMQAMWQLLENKIDKEVFKNVSARLKTQHKEALWWRDACVLYFQQYSKLPIPAPYEKPNRTLEEVKKLVDVYHVH